MKRKNWYSTNLNQQFPPHSAQNFLCKTDMAKLRHASTNKMAAPVSLLLTLGPLLRLLAAALGRAFLEMIFWGKKEKKRGGGEEKVFSLFPHPFSPALFYLPPQKWAGVTADLVPPWIWSPRGFGPPGPNLLVDLVPLNYILADLVPPPKCRFYLNVF